MKEELKSAYYILYDKNNVNAINKINKLTELYASFYRANDLLALKRIAKAIAQSMNNELGDVDNHDGIVNAINEIDFVDLESESVFFDIVDNDYEVQLNSFKETLKSIINKTSSNGAAISYDTNDVLKLNDLITQIDSYISNIYEDNAQTQSEINELSDQVSQIIENAHIIDSFVDVFNSFEKSYKNTPKEISIVKSRLLYILGKDVDKKLSKVNKVDIPPKYVINIGNANKDAVSIDKLVNVINSLYTQLYIMDDYEANMIYTRIMNEFVNAFEDGMSKAQLIDEIKNNLEQYNNANDNVRELVNEKINNVLGNLDDAYIYTLSDKNSVETFATNAFNSYTTALSKNQSTLDQINTKKAELEAAKQEYRDKHDGEDYDSKPLVEVAIKNMSSREDMTNSTNAIITKKKPAPSTQLVRTINLSYVTLEVNERETIRINISYLPENHRELSIDDLQITLSNDNVSIIEKELDHIIISGNVSGTCRIQFDVDNAYKAVTIRVNHVEIPEPIYFYAGTDDILLMNSAGIPNGINYNMAEQINSEDEFFDREENGVRYRLVKYTAPNYINYILVKRSYVESQEITILNSIQRQVNPMDIVLYQDDKYMVLDYSNANENNGNVYGFAGDMKILHANQGQNLTEYVIVDTISTEVAKDGYYYWYVGQINPELMDEIYPIRNDNKSWGWREIGTTKPSAGTVIFDGTTQDEIVCGTSKVTQYFAINSDVTIGAYDSFGTDQTSSTFTGPVVSNGMNIYTTVSKSKTFGEIIKVK